MFASAFSALAPLNIYAGAHVLSIKKNAAFYKKDATASVDLFDTGKFYHKSYEVFSNNRSIKA